MSEKRKINRRTKKQIARDDTIQYLKKHTDIDPESEEGKVRIQEAMDRATTSKPTSTSSPELKQAKKDRLSVKRQINKLNKLAEQVMNSPLNSDKNICHLITSFDELNKKVLELNGDSVEVNTDHIDSFVNVMFSKELVLEPSVDKD